MKRKHKYVDDNEHCCSSCVFNFKPTGSDYIYIYRCPKFVGARMDLSDKKDLRNLSILDLYDEELKNLKLPNELRRLEIRNVWFRKNLKFANLKLPNQLQSFYCDDESDVFAMLIENDYYDETRLMRTDVNVNYEKEFCVNGVSCKRWCLNLNWLFGNLNWWDWHLNIIIDRYCGIQMWG